MRRPAAQPRQPLCCCSTCLPDAQRWARHQMPVQQNSQHCNWLCRSVFGEDALVNVSVEKQSDGKLAGFIRIRSKTQVCSVLPE
jgi:Coatomer beta subunit appendage platform